MKVRIFLVAAVMFFGLSAAAFAQANFDTGSTPVTAVVKSGQTEKTGDITFTHTSGVSVAGTITISYGVPITIPLANITTTGTGGYVAPPPTVNVGASNNATGVLVINVPAGSPGGTIRVSGVRVAVAGTTLTQLDASLSSTGNTLTTGQLNPRVISAIAAGITSVTITPTTGIRVSAVSGAVTGNAVTLTSTGAPVATTGGTLRVLEGFLNAFGVTQATAAAGGDLSQTISTMVRITLSSAPPAGATVTFEGQADTIQSGTATVVVASAFSTADCSTGAISGANVAFTSTSTTLTVCYRVNVDPDVTQLERLAIDVGATAPGTATLPLAAAGITVTATFAPIGTAAGTGTAAAPAGPVPRYAADEVGTPTLLTVFGANTTLLIPFAQNFLGYDTGIALSNTSSDPGTTAMGGLTTAVKQNGTLTFHFYPQLPATASFTYTTKAGSPGSGLDANGLLTAGSTYTVLLSSLLSAAAQPAGFSGYIFVTCNFTNGHALYVVSNFTNFSQGSHALVIGAARNVAVAEVLGQ